MILRTTLRKTFVHDGVPYVVDTAVIMKHAAPGELELIQPFYFNGTYIESGFVWDGASSPGIPIARFLAPKFHKNIKASLVHDWLCRKARNQKERKKADLAYYLMKRYVEEDTEFRCKVGYAGVRAGALIGIGNRF